MAKDPFKVTENDVKRQLKQLLDFEKIWHFHILQGLGCYKGIPDRFAVHKGIVFAIECKKPGGQLSENQKNFRSMWCANYGNTYLVCANAHKTVDEIKGIAK